MTLFKKSIFLALAGLFLVANASAELYSQVGGTFQHDGCVYVLVHIYDDNGTDTVEDDEYVGSGAVNIGNCGPGAAGPAGSGGPSPDKREVFDLELSPVPVKGNTLTVDYLGREYSNGIIKRIDEPGMIHRLKEQDLEFKGKERIDLTGLEAGNYFILFGNDKGEKAVKKFTIE